MSRVFDKNAANFLQLDTTPAPLELVGAVDFTFFAWVKPTTVDTDGEIISRYPDNASRGMQFRISAGGNLFFWYINEADAGAGVTGVTVIGTGSWVPVALTYKNATKTQKVFVSSSVADGTNVAASNPHTVEASALYRIGKMASGTPNPFNGKIAHVAIWNTELSGANLNLLMGGSVPSSVSPGSLIAYWALGGTSPEIDSVAGYQMVINGSVPFDSDNPINIPISGGLCKPGAILGSGGSFYD